MHQATKAGRPLASAKALPPNAWFSGRLTFWAPEHPAAAVGPFRHSRLVRDLVSFGEHQTLIRASAEWLGSV